MGAAVSESSFCSTSAASMSPARCRRPRADRTSASTCDGAWRTCPAKRARTDRPTSFPRSRSTSADASATTSAMSGGRLVAGVVERLQGAVVRHPFGRCGKRRQPRVCRASDEGLPNRFLGDGGDVHPSVFRLRGEIVRQIHVESSHDTHYTHIAELALRTHPTASRRSAQRLRAGAHREHRRQQPGLGRCSRLELAHHHVDRD